MLQNEPGKERRKGTGTGMGERREQVARAESETAAAATAAAKETNRGCLRARGQKKKNGWPLECEHFAPRAWMNPFLGWGRRFQPDVTTLSRNTA